MPPKKRKCSDDDAKTSSGKKRAETDNMKILKGKPSDYCKNAACQGRDGNRRRKQSGLQGYCRQCAPAFIPSQVLQTNVAKHQQFYKEKKEKFPCDFCTNTYYHKIDKSTGKHYCVGCWPKRLSLALRCNFCCSEGSDVVTRNCSYRPRCVAKTVMCDKCFGIWQCGVCVSCWFTDFKRGCFGCKAVFSLSRCW